LAESDPGVDHPQFPSFSAEIARTTLSALKTGSIGRDFRAESGLISISPRGWHRADVRAGLDQKMSEPPLAIASAVVMAVPRSRPPCDGGAVRGRELGQAAGEIAQVQVQLVERKADGEDALHRVVR
jgi:hypothetical protein